MVKRILFPNGLRLILAEQPASLAATILVLVEAGSEYETKDISGLSHFLEHLCFKGTVERPRPGMIAEELDSLGAEYNAFTGQEYTGYWAKAEKHKVPQLIQIISDLYLNPVFNAAEIEKERGVVIEEINMYEDMPMRKVHDVFTSLLYGDQPAGWDVAGDKEVLKKLLREDFIKYRDERYIAPATAVIVSGSFDAKYVTKEIKKLFGKLPKKNIVPKQKTKESQKTPQVFLKYKKADQSHLVLGVRAFDVFDKRRYALHLLADILGGGMSSRLFHRVREELGAAYYIRADADLYLDHGYLAVSSGVNHPKIYEVIKVILEEFKKLKITPVTEAELQKTKDHFVGNLILGLETSDGLGSFYGEQEIIFRSVHEPAVLMENIRKVTVEDVNAVANDIFLDQNLNLAVIGPGRTKKPFESILTLKD
jgi:predicted Zn-dependent peptidase